VSRLRETLARALGVRRRRAEPPEGVRSVPFTFVAVAEDQPGDAFQARFEAGWDAYRAWYLQSGDAARPSYVECRSALREHMPELMPTYERVVELAGGGDTAARMLSLWCPPSYLTGCTQAVLFRPGPALVRNYDYDVHRIEGTIVRTAYTGRGVIGMSDCLWGLLDGINEAGLAASITFGGRRETGEGFGIPLVVRYVLELCETTEAAAAALARLPVHMAYNVTLVDRQGDSRTGFVGPGRPAELRRQEVVTNHQNAIEWEEYAAATRTLERESHLTAMVADASLDEEQMVRAFLDPPLYSRGFERGFGTLYTAVYRPGELVADYRWPGSTWRQSFDAFVEGEHTVPLIPDTPLA
jgi:predicted choloylglycine hydrolase